MQILQCSLSRLSLFFIYSRINILLLLEHSIFPRNFILEIRGYNQSFSRSRHNTMLFTCTTIEELESRAEKIFFFFFLPRCVTTSKLSVSRSCDVANRRCSNSTIQWLWVSNSVSGRGRGVSILVFHEPKFAVIEISWPGNRRTQCRTILKISTSRVSNYFFDYLSKISNEKIFE